MDETLNAPVEVTEAETINSNETVIIDEAPVDELPEHRFLSPDEITEEMREAGIDETTHIITDPEAIAQAEVELAETTESDILG